MKITSTAIMFCCYLSVLLVTKSVADSDPTTFREPDAPMSDEAVFDLSNIALGNAESVRILEFNNKIASQLFNEDGS